MKRRNVNKQKAATSFRKDAGRTKAANMAPAPMRGGYRL